MIEQKTPAAWLTPSRVLAFLLCLNLLNYMDRYVLSAVEPELRAALLSPSDPSAREKMGYLPTLFLVSYMLLSPAFGVLADRFNRWRLIGIGLLLWSVAAAASGLAHTYSQFAWSRVFIGVGEASYGAAAPAVIAAFFTQNRSRAMGIFYLAIPVGSALGFLAGGAIAARWGWRWAFIVPAIPGIVLSIPCWFLPDRFRVAGDQRAGLGDYKRLLGNWAYGTNIAGMTMMTFAIGAFGFWTPSLMRERFPSVAPEKATMLVGAVTVLAGLAGTLLGAWMGDRMRRRLPGGHMVVSGVGLLLSFPCIQIMLSSPWPWVWLWVFLSVFFLFLNTGPSNAAIADSVPEKVRAGAFALSVFVCHALGDAFSPPLIGRIADRYSLKAGFSVVAGAVLIGAAIWIVAGLYWRKLAPADEA